MIFFSLNLLKLFLYNPQIQSIFTLSPFILHLFFVYSPFILHLPVRLAPSFVRSLFVHCSSFVRHLFVICSSFVRHLFVHCSSFVRSLFVFCSFILYLPVWLTPLLFLLASNNLQFSILFPSSKNFSHFISHLLIFKFANSTYPFTTLYLLSFTFYLLPFNPFINH